MSNPFRRSRFRVKFVADRIVEYTDSDGSIKFFFDDNSSKGPKGLFLEPQPMIGPLNQLSVGDLDQDRLVIVLERVIGWLKAIGFEVVVVND